MSELPSFQDILLASLLVGVLFLLRFALTLRRLRSGRAAVESVREAVRRSTTPLGYGEDAEPDRRHAVRQLSVGLFFLALGLLLGLWSIASPVLVPLFR